MQRKFDRKGLGLEKTTTVTTDFKRKMSAVLKEFALSCTDDEFVFSSEFTLKEREEIHR